MVAIKTRARCYGESRRFVQYGLKSLFVSVVALGAVSAWIGTEVKRKCEQEDAVRHLQDMGCLCSFEDPSGIVAVTRKQLLASLGMRDPGIVVSIDFHITTIDEWIAMRGGFDGSHRLEKSDAALPYVARLPDLRTLDLSYNPITDAGLTQLGSLRMLSSLDLAGTSVTDDGLATLEHCVALRELRLSGTGVTNVGMIHLRRIPHLTLLTLGEVRDGPLLSPEWSWDVVAPTRVTDEGLAELAGCQELEALDLRGLGITDRGIMNLENLQQLRSLNLTSTKVTDKGLVSLARLRSLRMLCLTETIDGSHVTVTSITEDAVRRLRLAQPDLTVIYDPGGNPSYSPDSRAP